MDFRKANLINAAASGSTIPCPQCKAANKADAQNCISCGASLKKDAPAFAAAPKAAEAVQAPVSVFAEGLPAWDINPPQVMVRRR